MTNEEFSQILAQAVSGNHSALESILELYMPLINKQSVIDGCFDEDCKQYILMRIALQITRFKF